MEVTPASVVGEHVLLTGPIRGSVTLKDGTVVDVTPEHIELDPAKHEEVAFLIGEHWVQHGHPDDVEHDDATGEMVQRPFVHNHPRKFDKHPGKFKGKAAGRAHNEKG